MNSSSTTPYGQGCHLDLHFTTDPQNLHRLPVEITQPFLPFTPSVAFLVKPTSPAVAKRLGLPLQFIAKINDTRFVEREFGPPWTPALQNPLHVVLDKIRRPAYHAGTPSPGWGQLTTTPKTHTASGPKHPSAYREQRVPNPSCVRLRGGNGPGGWNTPTAWNTEDTKPASTPHQPAPIEFGSAESWARTPEQWDKSLTGLNKVHRTRRTLPVAAHPADLPVLAVNPEAEPVFGFRYPDFVVEGMIPAWRSRFVDRVEGPDCVLREGWKWDSDSCRGGW